MKKTNHSIASAYRKNQDKMMHYIMKRFGLTKIEAEDVYQELWIWILMKADNVPDLSNAENRAWMMSALIKFSLTHLRRKKNYNKLLNDWLEIAAEINRSAEKDISDPLYNLILSLEILALFEVEYGKEQRELLQLFYIEEYSVEKLALRYEQAEQTIKNKLTKCKKLIRAIVEANGA